MGSRPGRCGIAPIAARTGACPERQSHACTRPYTHTPALGVAFAIHTQAQNPFHRRTPRRLLSVSIPNTHRGRARPITFDREPKMALFPESKIGLRKSARLVARGQKPVPHLTHPLRPRPPPGVSGSRLHSQSLSARLPCRSPRWYLASLVARRSLSQSLVAFCHSSLTSLVARRSSFGVLAASPSRPLLVAPLLPLSSLSPFPPKWC